nr:MAG TPA: hypothetical protein [Caudoviricetes sp.]
MFLLCLTFKRQNKKQLLLSYLFTPLAFTFLVVVHNI